MPIATTWARDIVIGVQLRHRQIFTIVVGRSVLHTRASIRGRTNIMATGYGALTNLAPSARIIPPYPPRPDRDIPPWRRLKLAQENLIAIFEASAFERDLSETKILTKRVFLCNSPELVQYAFSIKNENFERKSSAMRHMLKPLMGDGLFYQRRSDLAYPAADRLADRPSVTALGIRADHG